MAAAHGAEDSVAAAPARGVDRRRLRGLATFAGCSDAELDDVLAHLPLVTADAGAVVVREGDVGDFAYIILSGEATVTQRGSTIATLESGDLFGEMAMVAGGVRTATVGATTRLELLRLDAPTLSQITGTQTIAWNLLQALIGRMRDREAERGAPAATAAPTAVDAPVADAGAGLVGEHLSMAERVVVAPTFGTFRPRDQGERATDGEPVTAGQVLGYVGSLADEAEVRSPFAGFLMGMLALPGERVHAGQPVAWLRTF